MPHPLQLTFDLLTLKLVSESRVTWPSYLCANFSLPRPLCSRLRPDVRDRQTDRRQTDVRRTSSLNALTIGAGHNNSTSGLSIPQYCILQRHRCVYNYKQNQESP